MVDQDSAAKRLGLAIIAAIACAYAAAGAGVSDAPSVGAICGAAGYSIVSARYGVRPSSADIAKEDLWAAGVMAAIGFLFKTDSLDLPETTKAAVVAAMVVAGATEIVKGAGVSAGFNALMATAVVAILCSVLAGGIHALGGNDLLIGAATGFVVVIIGLSPISAYIGAILGASLRLGIDNGFQAIAGLFR
ncbi:hypothetical protein V3H18_10265 [Methylocystis sp. 9N]|uniref:Uncharacterized protein n=1 Tax=Methylocystis borbori TaxID=3118750 RepID=A0ABU7XHQ5_9HYPH